MEQPASQYSGHDLLVIAGLAKVDLRTVKRHLIEQRPTVRPLTRDAIERACRRLADIQTAEVSA